jgi:hypothetical protein
LSASSNAVLVPGSDAVVKLMPVRRDVRHRSTTRPWALVAVALALQALRSLTRSKATPDRRLRFAALGRAVPTRAPPRLQLA